jgi:hypothetical protein
MTRKTKKGYIIVTNKGLDISTSKHPRNLALGKGKKKVTHKKSPYEHWGNVYTA